LVVRCAGVQGLKGYFASLRAAFDDLTISRGIMVVEGDYVACQTTIAGTFVREFTRSPVGPLPPNGRRVVFELIRLTTAAGCASWALKAAEQVFHEALDTPGVRVRGHQPEDGFSARESLRDDVDVAVRPLHDVDLLTHLGR
jgi:hypothetical protein